MTWIYGSLTSHKVLAALLWFSSDVISERSWSLGWSPKERSRCLWADGHWKWNRSRWNEQRGARRNEEKEWKFQLEADDKLPESIDDDEDDEDDNSTNEIYTTLELMAEFLRAEMGQN